MNIIDELAAGTDNGEAFVVLAAVRNCAKHWVPEARIIGNVRAGDIVRAIEEADDRIEQLEAFAEAIIENEYQFSMEWAARKAREALGRDE
jgi:hypothetical protein